MKLKRIFFILVCLTGFNSIQAEAFNCVNPPLGSDIAEIDGLTKYREDG